MIRLLQHRHKCIGCNDCVEAAPFRWRLSKKDGKCTLIGGKEKKGWYSVVISEDEKEENIRAAKNCPVNIIRLEDAAKQ